MPPSKKFYLFRKLVKNAKWWSKSNLPPSHSPDRKIFPIKKRFKKLLCLEEQTQPLNNLLKFLLCLISKILFCSRGPSPSYLQILTGIVNSIMQVDIMDMVQVDMVDMVATWLAINIQYIYQVNTAVRPPPPPPEEIEPTVEPVRTVTLATCLMKWFLNFKL